jgi:hypothetical protein
MVGGVRHAGGRSTRRSSEVAVSAAAAPTPMVDGRGHSVWQLMANMSYRLDYFQREYVWRQENVDTLVKDLTRTFFAA